MEVLGSMIIITSAAQYELLRSHPASLHGWFDPAARSGEVWFASPPIAAEVWRRL